LPTDGPVILDVPEPNEAAMRLAERLGLAQVFETARMYAGPAPALDLNRIYGIPSFELYRYCDPLMPSNSPKPDIAIRRHSF
jgi:hypothetical protein